MVGSRRNVRTVIILKKCYFELYLQLRIKNLSIIIRLHFFIFRVAVRERSRQHERKLHVWNERLVSVRQRLSKLKDMVI